MYSPVVVFTYNRFEEIMKVMAALAQNIGADRTDVYVFSNAPVSAAILINPEISTDNNTVTNTLKNL